MSPANSSVDVPSTFTIDTRITEEAMIRLDQQRRRMALGGRATYREAWF